MDSREGHDLDPGTDKGKERAFAKGKINEDREPSSKFTTANFRKNNEQVVSSIENSERSSYLRNLDAFDSVSSSFLNEEKLPDANSEKELGNDYFKHKKYHEAIECYSRSIAFAPTSVAYANRAMAYLKVKKFEEADNDCTDALNLDDRYVKAYSRRATSRKALMKLEGALEDADFALRLEPNNPEIRKQYSEIKEILEKKGIQNVSGQKKSNAASKESQAKGIINSVTSTAKTAEASTAQTMESNLQHARENSEQAVKGTHDMPKGIQNVSGQKKSNAASKESQAKGINSVTSTAKTVEASTAQTMKGIQNVSGQKKSNAASKESQAMGINSITCTAKTAEASTAQTMDLASRAASRVMESVSKNVTTPTSAYLFEVSWRSLSNDSGKQTQLLKTIPPADLPKIFKNALSAPVLIDVIRCISTFFTDDTVLAVSMIDYLTKVPRFDMIIMCLSTMDRAELHRLWEEVFSSDKVEGDLKQVLSRLRPKYYFQA